ncbi:MAG: hypothetical protein HY901_33925 [Deltaproteobacteria bacterium]|nr:hypothetical protein [Deltaproteobacteria bacterium]
MTTTRKIAGASIPPAKHPPMSTYLAAQLKPLNDQVSLKILGEDDSGSARVGACHGPLNELTPETLTKALGFKMETAQELHERVVRFDKIAKNDAEFWDDFLENQDEPAAGAKAQELLTGKNVAEVAAMVVNENTPDHHPSSATAFLAARLTDGSMVYLRGTVGGMGF